MTKQMPQIISGVKNTTNSNMFNLLSKKIYTKQQELQKEKKLLDLILNSLSVGVLVLNKKGRLILANNASRTLFKHVLGLQLKPGYNFKSNSEDLLLNSIETVHEGHERGAIIIQPKPGLYIQISDLELGQQLDYNLYTILELRDISSSVELDNLRHQFISTVSHELRTPLSVIVQSLENLRRYHHRLSGDLKNKILDLLWKNANLMTELVDDLLLVTRIDAKKLGLRWTQYDLEEVIQSVISQMESRRQAKEINIETAVNRFAPLYGDPKRIGQVCRIFIDNAIKYSSPKTKILITGKDPYKGKYNPDQTNGVLVNFSDQGRGIKEEDLPSIFERFFRSDDVRDLPGTGLGLSIAKELITLHNGNIYIQSKYGKGTTFSIFLPRIDQKENLRK